MKSKYANFLLTYPHPWDIFNKMDADVLQSFAKGSETMDSIPRSPLSGFKPQCENRAQFAGAYRRLLSIVRQC
jgi:hypothetical protein